MPGPFSKKISSLQRVINKIKSKKLEFEYGKLNKEISNEDQSIKYKLDSKFNIYPFRDNLKVDIVGFYVYKPYKIIKCINSVLYQYPSHYSLSSCDEFNYFIILDELDQFYLKEKLPLLNEETLNIHKLLLTWCDEASIETGNKIFSKLLKLNLSDNFKKCNKTLYRGFNLSPLAIKKLSNGKSIQLQKRLFSSWTENKEYTEKFKENDKICAIFIFTPINEVIININLFEQEVFNTLKYYPNSREKEIILLNSPRMLILNPNQIIDKTNKWKEITTEHESFLDINLNSSFN